MIRKDRNISLKLWVWLCMLVLAFFLIYWNYSNYNSKKKQLKEGIESQLQIAYANVMDSVIVDEIVIMSQTSDFHPDSYSNIISMDKKIDNITIDTFIRKLKIISSNNSSAEDSIEISNQSKDTIEEFNLAFGNNKSNFNIHSSIGHFKEGENIQSGNLSFIIDGIFAAKDDHKPRIIEVFKEKLDLLNYPSQFIIDSFPKHSSISIYHKGERENDISINLGIMNHQFHIFKELLPSILFSFLLFSMVGAAFWLLIQNWSKQQKLIKIKNEFISNMTHELKTPISTVGVALEAIAGFDLTKEQEKTKEYIQISRHELNRLTLLVDKVLKMSTFESSDQILKNEPINLASTTENILKSIQLHLEEKNATVNYKNTAADSLISGDIVHITNVIYNIIDNAIKYSIDTPLIDIELAEDQNNYLKLSIRDHGVGIPTEYQVKIFERFFRIPNNDRHNVKGHGLGLSYVKDIITKHGGHIKAEPPEGNGIKFVISLPKSI